VEEDWNGGIETKLPMLYSEQRVEPHFDNIFFICYKRNSLIG